MEIIRELTPVSDSKCALWASVIGIVPLKINAYERILNPIDIIQNIEITHTSFGLVLELCFVSMVCQHNKKCFTMEIE